jgi:hypothetical protein
VGELNLKLELISPDRFVTNRAGLTQARPAPHTVGAACWQFFSADRFSGLLSEDGLVRREGGQSGARQMPMRPAAGFRHPGARWKASETTRNWRDEDASLGKRHAFVESQLTNCLVPLQRVAGPRSFTVSPVRTFAPFSSL